MFFVSYSFKLIHFSEKTCSLECHCRAKCVITVNNTFTCKCNEGFSGNGTFCKS